MSLQDVLRKYEGRESGAEFPTFESPSISESKQPTPGDQKSQLDDSSSRSRMRDWGLDEFERSGEILKVRSRVLGEDVWFVANRSLRAKVPDRSLTVYTARELRRLTAISPEDLINIHRLKKTFDGEIEN